MAELAVEIAGIKLKNPVIAASGTYGFGREYAEYVDLKRLGGIAVKGLTLNPREGNKPPRIAETPSGMLNSVGLQNPGIKHFIMHEIPFLEQYGIAIIANIAGNTVEEYSEIAGMLEGTSVDAIEVNVSCPNVKQGCAVYGASAAGVAMVTSAVRKATSKPVIVKLSPNVTSIAEVSQAAEGAGADAVSLINTILGMSIDIETKRPVLGNNFGGLSGPAVKPVALRMVFEASNSVKIPVIGMGGICCAGDAVEFMLAGASAVMVGTANFVNPSACLDIADGIRDYLDRSGHKAVAEIIGALKMN